MDQKVDIEDLDFRGPGELSHHVACAVVYDKLGKVQSEHLNFYSKSDKRKLVPISQILLEGVYFYGGRKPNGELNKELFILLLGAKPMRWVCP